MKREREEERGGLEELAENATKKEKAKHEKKANASCQLDNCLVCEKDTPFWLLTRNPTWYAPSSYQRKEHRTKQTEELKEKRRNLENRIYEIKYSDKMICINCIIGPQS